VLPEQPAGIILFAHGIEPAESRLLIVPGATHLFEEPGALEQVASLATDWFSHYLG
jgi:hypothetical protein